ncbi:MAG: PTS IIA-like nitrogen regulatory protein PtsN [Enterovibrio sp.]
MQLTDILDLDCTKSAVLFSSKKRAFEFICDIAGKKLQQNPQVLFESLLARERMGSTSIGAGIAFPHGKLSSGDKAVGVFINLEEALDFDAIDNQNVDLVFALFVPEELCQVYSPLLSAFAEMLGDKQLCRQLRLTQDDEALYQLITDSFLQAQQAEQVCS